MLTVKYAHRQISVINLKVKEKLEWKTLIYVCCLFVEADLINKMLK